MSSKIPPLKAQNLQLTPWAQFQCALMGTEGWIANLEEGASDPQEAVSWLRAYVERLKEFAPYFEGVTWDEGA